jgi:hypothetical protein
VSSSNFLSMERKSTIPVDELYIYVHTLSLIDLSLDHRVIIYDHVCRLASRVGLIFTQWSLECRSSDHEVHSIKLEDDQMYVAGRKFLRV